MAIAYQYDASGFFAGENEDYGVLPNNATYKKPPTIQLGKWPCWTGKAWKQVEDHRERENLPDLVALYGDNFPQDGTEYWLLGDTHESTARHMKEIGPLPEGALLERPAKPEPTAFERIAEVQVTFIEQQQAAKSDFLTARIEGNTDWEQEAQEEYQTSVEAMSKATEAMKNESLK